MSLRVQSLALLLLLIVAQQGAVAHDLSHLRGADSLGLSDAAISDASCALCPAFAQANTPAFSHSFHLPHLLRAAPQISAAPLYAVIDRAAPRPRSRGPPV